MEQTLSIIKPDAVKKNVIGKILSRFESAGLKIVACKLKHLTQTEAEGFYAEHKERPFFNDLVAFMTSGPVSIQVWGENAIALNRNSWVLQSKRGGGRYHPLGFAESIDANAVHGSDSASSASREINYFSKLKKFVLVTLKVPLSLFI